MPVSGYSLRGLLTHNKRLKGLSVLLGILTWAIIQDAISFEIEIPEVRLLVQVQSGMAILNQSVATVNVTLRGSQEDIRLVDPRNIQAVVDLKGDSGPLPQEIELTPRMIRGLRGARAVAVYPARLLVTLDRQDEKRVVVKGRTMGTPLSGQVDAVTCEPAMVTLKGPAMKLATTDYVTTVPVDVDGRVESFSRRTAVLTPADNWTADVTPAEVQVKVMISGKK